MRVRKTAAYTLVETLVVVAVGVVVAGLALDALIETNRAATAVSDQLIAVREAQAIAEQIEKAIHRRLPPSMRVSSSESLRSEMLRFDAAFEETSATASAPSIEDTPSAISVGSLTIRNDLERKQVVLEESLAPQKNSRKILGMNKDSYCAEVSFAFAEGFSGFTPSWKDVPSTVPQLLQIDVRVWPRVAGMASFEQARQARFKRYAELQYWVKWQ
jgi:type II secretory pathway pseudopilin PulG